METVTACERCGRRGTGVDPLRVWYVKEKPEIVFGVFCSFGCCDSSAVDRRFMSRLTEADTPNKFTLTTEWVLN